MSDTRGARGGSTPGKAPELIRLVNSGPMTQALCVAAELQIPDLLAAGPRHAEELAEATGTHGPSLHRLMRALTSLNICVEREDGSFGLIPTRRETDSWDSHMWNDPAVKGTLFLC
jgi:hypothetical protein